VWGTTPTSSLVSEYWDTYLALLYNPRTRLVDASAVIGLADYFDLELNDIAEFRGNYYHLRAINDYNLTTGECNIQMLGPIIADTISSILTGSWAPTTDACAFTYTASLYPCVDGTGSLSLYQSYQGGKIVYFYQPGDVMYQSGYVGGVITAEYDIPIDNSNAVPDSEPWREFYWANGGIGDLIVTNATASYAGGGLINTNQIINIQGNPNPAYFNAQSSSYAAWACANFSGSTGYSDWVLPTINDLIYTWYGYMSGSFPNALESNNRLGFSTGSGYWTSTEYSGSTVPSGGTSASLAYYVSQFRSGSISPATVPFVNLGFKTSVGFRVRPVRYFSQPICE